MFATLRCFWTDRAIWVKSIATLEILEPLETLAERAARSAASLYKIEAKKVLPSLSPARVLVLEG